MKVLKIPHWPLALGPWLALAVGMASNALVMALNHSQMPVNMPPGLLLSPEDWIHSVMTSATHLKVLADWIVIRGVGIASPGDLGIWAWEYSYIPAAIAWVTMVIRDHNDAKDTYSVLR